MFLLCPKCKVPNLADMSMFWLVPIEREPIEDDEMFKCWQCWSTYTLGFIKQNQPVIQEMPKSDNPMDSRSMDTRLIDKMRNGEGNEIPV